MIDNRQDYEQALVIQARNRLVAKAQQNGLEMAGYSQDEIERAMEPVRAFYAQLDEDIAAYAAAYLSHEPRATGGPATKSDQ